MEPHYGITREFPDLDYDQAVAATVEALKEVGFGVLTEIDVKATLKKKLDVDFERYVILGACNPPLAHRALTAEPWIGLLLPCNVVVRERPGGGSLVSAAKPTAMFEIVQREGMEDLAAEVEGLLEKALDSVAAHAA